MEVRIGLVDTSQSVIVNLDSDIDPKDLKSTIEDALNGKNPVLCLTDSNSREVVIVASKITHVEIVPAGARTVGFG